MLMADTLIRASEQLRHVRTKRAKEVSWPDEKPQDINKTEGGSALEFSNGNLCHMTKQKQRRESFFFCCWALSSAAGLDL